MWTEMIETRELCKSKESNYASSVNLTLIMSIYWPTVGVLAVCPSPSRVYLALIKTFGRWAHGKGDSDFV